jgi:tetratricopeptide (TPR) repeat protein
MSDEQNEVAARAEVEALEASPFVRALRDALRRAEDVPPPGEPPPGLETWALVAQLRGETALARLAGLSLLASGRRSLAAALAVLGHARREDLPTVRDLVPHELTSVLNEVEGLLDRVPVHVGDLLLGTLLPLPGRADAALGGLAEHLHTLRPLVSADRPWLTGIVDTLTNTLALANGPGATAFRNLVAAVVDQIGALEQQPPASVKRIIGAAPPVADTGAAIMALGGLDAMGTLVAALLLRRHDLGPEPRVHLALDAADAIFRLRATGWFPLRRDLLREVAASHPVPEARVHALVGLANTLSALAEGDRDGQREAVSFSRAAAKLAYSLGDAQGTADAVTLSARLLRNGLLEGPDGLALRRVALDELDQISELPIDDEGKGRAAWAAAALWMDPCGDADAADFARASTLLEKALSLLPDDDWKGDAEQELAHAWSMTGRLADALRVAQRALDGASPNLPDRERGTRHHQVAECLRRVGRDSEAERHYQEAIRCLGAAHEGLFSTLRYAFLLHDHGRDTEALQLVERLRRQAARVLRPDLRDLLRLHEVLLRRLGRNAAADHVHAEALDLVAGTAWESVLHLDHARGLGTPGAVVAVALEYVRGRWPVTREADRRFAEALSKVVQDIPEERFDVLLPWAAERGGPWLHACLLGRSDRKHEAVEVLTAAVGRGASPPNRLNLRLLLLALMDHADIPGMRSVIEAIENDAGDPTTLPATAQVDIAAGCEAATAGEVGWSDRAIAYSARAFEFARREGWVQHAAWTWVRLIYRRVEMEIPRSTPALADLVVTCTPALPFIPAEHGDLPLALVSRLLVPGPLTHPRVLEAAQAILSQLPRSRDEADLQARVNSIREVLDGRVDGPIAPMPRTQEPGPLDLPDLRWLVRLLQGELTHPLERSEDWEMVTFAANIRPDRADVILAGALPAAGDAMALDLVRDSMERLGPGVERWPGVARFVEAQPRNRALAGLRRALRLDDAPDDEPVDDAMTLFHRACAAMDRIRHTKAGDEEAAALKRSAIRDLEAALALTIGDPVQIDILTSLGNAARLPPDPDPDAAFRRYEQAAALGSEHPQQLGKLHKVWADALRERGGPWPEAARHAEIALRHRTGGWLRAETLFGAARIADERTDWDPVQRDREVVRLSLEAVASDAGVAQQMADWVFNKVARLARRDPAAVLSARGPLVAVFPDRATDIERALTGLTTGPLGPTFAEDEVADHLKLQRDPDWQAFVEAHIAIENPDVLIEQTRAAMARLGLAGRIEDRFETEIRERNTTPALRRLLAELATGPNPAGRAVGIATLLGELVRRGEASIAEVRGATEAAVKAIRASSAPPDVRAMLLHHLGEVWSPDDHVADPVLDFDLAVALRRAGAEIAGGLDKAPRDILGGLGRALRYARAGDHTNNLVEARRLYERVLEIDRAAGNAQGVANTYDLLADLADHLADGRDVDRLEESVRLHREAVRMAAEPARRARYLANLAWALTCLGQRSGSLANLQEARHIFEEARATAGPRGLGAHVENNEMVCLEAISESQGDTDYGVRARSEYEEKLRTGHPVDHAKAQHNLSQSLIRRGAPGDHDRAIELLRDALRDRTIDINARHHWETAIELARALLRARPHEWRNEALASARTAIKAANVLGAGTELAHAAVELGRAALHGDSVDEVRRVAEEAWAALQKAMGALLLDEHAGWNEAVLAQTIALRLADLELRTRVVGRSGGVWMLAPMASELVTGWLTRADAAYARQVEARVNLPATVPASLRMAWLDALAAGRSAELTGLVRQIRADAPGWLATEPSLAETRRWLDKDAHAIGLWLTEEGVLAAVLRPGSASPTVMYWQAPIPDLDEADLAAALRSPDRADALEDLTRWVREFVTGPLLRTTKLTPSRILWVPHGLLRLLPPAMLLPGFEVHLSASLALRPPGRRRDGAPALVLASPASRDDLGGDMLRGVERLHASLPRASLLVHTRSGHGRALSAAAVDVPVTTQAVLRELDHAAFAVVCAHGHVESEARAWIDLVRPDGSVDALDIDVIARHPQVFSGLTLVLLSCETGRAGAAPHRPGGIAGALLAAGAREVVAPLWPVSAHAALGVAEALCEAWRRKEPLGAALAKVVTVPAGGVALGRPSQASIKASAWESAAFVTWVG